MTLVVVARAAREKVLMERANAFFDMTLTPFILTQIRGLSKEDMIAWWDGFGSSLVGAMSVTVGERKCMQICEDLYERAKEFDEDLRKQGLGVCSAMRPAT
jgi:hypothetical protein